MEAFQHKGHVFRIEVYHFKHVGNRLFGKIHHPVKNAYMKNKRVIQGDFLVEYHLKSMCLLKVNVIELYKEFPALYSNYLCKMRSGIEGHLCENKRGRCRGNFSLQEFDSLLFEEHVIMYETGIVLHEMRILPNMEEGT